MATLLTVSPLGCGVARDADEVRIQPDPPRRSPANAMRAPPRENGDGAIDRLSRLPATTPTRQWHVRVPRDFSPPSRWAVRLDDDATLVILRNAAQWRMLFEGSGWVPPATPRFGAGVVVGLIVDAGEPADPQTPAMAWQRARIDADGTALVEAQSPPGVFRPVLTHRHGALAQFPGVQRVRVLQMNERLFVIE